MVVTTSSMACGPFRDGVAASPEGVGPAAVRPKGTSELPPSMEARGAAGPSSENVGDASEAGKPMGRLELGVARGAIDAGRAHRDVVSAASAVASSDVVYGWGNTPE